MVQQHGPLPLDGGEGAVAFILPPSTVLKIGVMYCKITGYEGILLVARFYRIRAALDPRRCRALRALQILF